MQTEVGIANGGFYVTVEYGAEGARALKGGIAPGQLSDRLVVPPNPDTWGERKARALHLGEAILDHLDALHRKEAQVA